MVRWGNKRANEYWEANVPEDYYIPDENDSVAAVERWIRDKYERGKFKAKSTPKWADDDIDLNQPMSVLVGGGSSGDKKEKKEKKEKDSTKVSIKVNAVTGSSSTSSTPNPSSTVATKSSTATPIVTTTPAAGLDSFDLLGFDAFPTPVVPATTITKPTTTTSNNIADLTSAFGNFGVNPSTSNTANFDPFGTSSSASATTVATPNPTATANNILNLYATNVPTQPNMMMNNPFGNNMAPMQPNMMMGNPGMMMPNMGNGMMMPNMMMGANPNMMMPNMMGGNPGMMMPNMMPQQQQPQPFVQPVPTTTTSTPASSINTIDPFASF